MTEYEMRTTGMIVAPKTQPIFSELATEVRIVDESGGEFVEVEQHGRTDLGKIAISPPRMAHVARRYRSDDCRMSG